MLNSINPLQTGSWKKLKKHHESIKNVHMKELFEQDPERFKRFSIRWREMLVDFSKNIATEDTIALLIELANETELADAIEKMYTGDKINGTEKRSVLHVALRNISNTPISVDGKNVMPEVNRVLDQISRFSEKLESGEWRGYSGKKIRHIVNIGIGGSDLGPSMVTECLKPYWRENIKPHFVSNVDGTHIIETLKQVDHETTLFLIASKTFTTLETMTNANTAREWFLMHANDSDAVKYHFAAISTNIEAAVTFGISKENIFEFWDWVGGRFSLWSSIGLSIVCAIGFDNFKKLLKGAHEMDNHFRNTPFEHNIPVILALISIWYINFFDIKSEVILPYDQYMHRFPAYFQQGNMESNGKSVDRNGFMIASCLPQEGENSESHSYATGPVIWGEPGTNGQHAFYQLIHQGSQIIPADFLAPAKSHNPICFKELNGEMSTNSQTDYNRHHKILLSNFFAQSEALMNGKEIKNVINEMKAKGYSSEEIARISPHKVFQGNKPSNSILFKQLTPETLGSLIAMYEHKIFVQGVIWNIYSFDQWGVELGKELAGRVLSELHSDAQVCSHDSSTNGLINTFKAMCL